MKNLQSFFFSTTIAAATATVATLTALPVQAISLNASIGLTGTVEFDKQGMATIVDFTSSSVVAQDVQNKYGDFANVTSLAAINTLTIDGILSFDPILGIPTQEVQAVETFIDFGLQDLKGNGNLSRLTFDLDEGQALSSFFFMPSADFDGSVNSVGLWQGTFNYGGEEFAGTAQFGASKSGNATSLQMTLTTGNGGDISPESVPEPSTLFGLGAVFALGALSRKRC